MAQGLRTVARSDRFEHLDVGQLHCVLSWDGAVGLLFRGKVSEERERERKSPISCVGGVKQRVHRR